MNHGVKTYRSPTRMQLRDARFQRKNLDEKFTSALDDIAQISMAAKENVAHVDPVEHIGNLKEKSDTLFTPIPDTYKPTEAAKKKGNQYASVESRLKPTLESNKDWETALKDRPTRKPGSHEAIVSTKAPLKLSFDAERILKGKKENHAQSTLSGLFTQNAAITNGEQGPVPPLYNPPEDNRKAQVAKKREEAAKMFIPVDKTRKAKILAVKERPKPAKVDKDYVPACAASDHKAAAGAERKAEVAQRNAERAKKCVGKSFK